MLGQPELERMLHDSENSVAVSGTWQRNDAARGQAARCLPFALQAEMLSKVDFSDAFIINDFVGFAVGKHAAVVDDVGAVADAQGFAHVMVSDQHADVAFLEKPA